MKLWLDLAGSLAALTPPELLPPGPPRKDELDVLGMDYAPFSTLTWCLSRTLVQYFLVAVVLSVCRIFGLHAASPRSVREASPIYMGFEAGAAAFNAAPMLCVLFLAAQMQAMHLTEGRAGPSHWARTCMQLATAALTLQLLISVSAPAVTGKASKFDMASVLAPTADGPLLAMVISGTASILTCVACIGLCVSLFAAPASTSRLPEDHVAPAVACTVALCLQYFTVHVLLATVGGIRQAVCGGAKKLAQVLRLAASTVSLAPALSVLFIAARIRAVQADFNGGNPQRWAQNAFFVCVCALLVQTLLVVIVPYLPSGDARRGDADVAGDVELALTGPGGSSLGVVLLLAVARCLPYLVLGGGVVAVMVSVLLVHSPDGTTPDMPPSVICVMVMVGLCFAIHVSIWLSYVGQAVSSESPPKRRRSHQGGNTVVPTALHEMLATARYLPMLGMLFLAVRLRAQQVSGRTGAPQGWAQDTMYLCTVLVVLRLIADLTVGITEDAPAEAMQSADRHSSPSTRSWALWAQTVLLVSICGAAFLICVALWTLNAASAGAAGAVLS
eukprot:TRINITY_DN37978_c0_g1_i1.p1 TRINITY_DN37978_c0_g1~~TRINITY_DN37978_c0_g1_i1.p1  ORF type:complete len:559 (-),score=81.06 TRINITY_DN37978_c0_g1_i1:69-1745(-)